MILVVGEILFDLFPDYKRMGGAPFNFASHLNASGFPVILVSRIGRDENGRQILKQLEKQNFDLEYIQQDECCKTGSVQVKLNREGIPRFDIEKNAAYDHIQYKDEISTLLRLHPPRLIYYGTLLQRTPSGADTILKIIKTRHSDTVCFYDINLRPGCYSKEVIESSLTNCDILKLNSDEFEILRRMLDCQNMEKAGVEQLMEQFDIEWVCLTRGSGKSTLYTRQGNYSAESGKVEHIVDTVGAGDAYAAVLAAGYLLEWPPEIILSRAAQFAGAICGIAGAIPDEKFFYRDFTGWINKEKSR